MDVRTRFFRSFFVAFGVLIIGSARQGHAMARPTPRPAPVPSIPLGQDREHGEFFLRVMTYNIHGLPIPENDTSRLADIGRELARFRREGSQPHIVGIQEGFHVAYRDLIREAAYPYRKDGSGPGEGVFIGSGLSILSELPLSEAKNHDFDRDNLVGFDWQARKGVQFTKVKIPGLRTPLSFYNTHLQADYADWTAPLRESIAARIRQYSELRSFFFRTSPSELPAIFVGDFNTHLLMSDYRELQLTLPFRHVIDPCGLPAQCVSNADPVQDASSALDHQLYRSDSNAVRITPTHYLKRFEERVGGRLLSDHEALEIHYKIEW